MSQAGAAGGRPGEEHPGLKVQDPATSALGPAADAAVQAG